MRSLYRNILAVLFPDRCVGCRAPGSLLCSVCFAACLPARRAEQAFIMSVFSYADPRMRLLVKKLKYSGTKHAAGIFARPMAEALSEFLGEEGMFFGSRQILLVPVPLSRRRARSRGYNQAELLAREMQKALPTGSAPSVRVETGLIRKVRDTVSQARIRERGKRLENLDNCFFVAGRENVTYDESVIVLVDDVSTTGATLMAAARALTRAGYSRIFALTAAH